MACKNDIVILFPCSLLDDNGTNLFIAHERGLEVCKLIRWMDIIVTWMRAEGIERHTLELHFVCIHKNPHNKKEHFSTLFLREKCPVYENTVKATYSVIIGSAGYTCQI